MGDDGKRSHRTQIILNSDQFDYLTDLAARRGVSKGHLVREAVAQYQAGPSGSDDDLQGLVALGASGDPRASETHDEVIYRRR